MYWDFTEKKPHAKYIHVIWISQFFLDKLKPFTCKMEIDACAYINNVNKRMRDAFVEVDSWEGTGLPSDCQGL